MTRKALAFAAGMLALPLLTVSAQTRGGVTKTELLALQQQMRDEGCGNKHAAGAWDAETRQAIRTCAKKYNTAADAKALLVAMDIGFGEGSSASMGGMAMGGMAMGGMAMSGDMKGMDMAAMHEMMMTMSVDSMMKMMQDPAMQAKHESMMKMMMNDPKMKAKHDSMMKMMMSDPAMKAKHDSLMQRMMQDPAMKAKHDSMMKMMHDSTMKHESMKH